MNFSDDLFIIGDKIETKFGSFDYVKVKDYPHIAQDLDVVSWSKEQIVYSFYTASKNKKLDLETRSSIELIVQKLKSMSLYQIVTDKEFAHLGIVHSYLKVFQMVNENLLSHEEFGEEEFIWCRSLILRMNGLKEEKYNPNPEIQDWIEKSKRVKAANNDKLTFADILSSIAMFSGIDYSLICEWSLFRLYYSFHRIGIFKNYDTSILFATVPSDKKIDIENWSKSVDLFDEGDSNVLSRDELKKKSKIFEG